MASLPEDDGPTMVGAPGEQRVAPRLPTGDDGQAPADDTTSALLGPPAAPPAPEPVGELSDDDLDSDDEDEPEEHTVQQAMPPSVAAAAARARNAPVAPTKPSNHPVPGIGPTAREAAKTDATDLTDDDEPLEDSITATAPRLDAANLMEAAQSGRGVPVSIPGRVEIRTLDDDDDDDDDAGDETEVRTLPGHGALAVPAALRGGAPLPAPRPAAGRPPELAPELAPEPEPEPDGGPDDDGVTAQAVAPRLGSVPDIGAPLRAPSTGSTPAAAAAAIIDEPPTRPGIAEAEEPLTRPGLGAEVDPPTRPGLEAAGEPATRPGLADPPTGKVERKPESAGYANDQDDEESVTSRGPLAEPYVDDSVTTQAPNVPLELINAAIKAAEAAAADDGSLDDSSADTTKKLRKPKLASTVPADEEAESITTQAPGHVTNMLRVIASGSSPDIAKGKVAPIDDEDEGPENRTAVMANAPLKRVIQEVESASRLPAIRPTGGPLSHGPMGAAAPRLEPSSESGLRVARAGSGSNERASLGQLLASGDARNSGAHPASLANDGSMSSSMDRSHGGVDKGSPHLQPSLHDVDLGKGPSYGLLVAIVAVISIVVPVTLFVVLRHGSDVAPPAAAPAEPASEVEKPGVAAPRGKSPRGKNGLTIVPSAAVSASAAPQPSATPSSAPSGKPTTKGFPFGRR